jgi:fructose/tagatose bisphosphate aldolase
MCRCWLARPTASATFWEPVKLPPWFAVCGKSFNFPIFLNADHTHTLAKAIEAARAGFDSIVFDASAHPFEQNVRQTKEAVEALKSINPAILVEGEIGDIGTGSEIHESAPDLVKGLTGLQHSHHCGSQSCESGHFRGSADSAGVAGCRG